MVVARTRFALYRIVGNDLVPRHRPGQARDNLRFILDHEPPLPNCEKHWVVNRIVDRDEEAKIIELLESHGQPFLHIPFDLDEYARVGWDLECFPERGYLLSDRFRRLPDGIKLAVELRTRYRKNRYAMNNNGARNAALREGRTFADWVLPWDGNCFVTASGWDELRGAVEQQPDMTHFVVPMARIPSNGAVLEPGFRPDADDEPQIAFRRDATEEFDEAHPYGRRSKVELLVRLGVRGPWDTWPTWPWDLPLSPPASTAPKVGSAGWVARLESGQPALDGGAGAPGRRGLVRSLAIAGFLDRLDQHAMRAHIDAARLGANDTVRDCLRWYCEWLLTSPEGTRTRYSPNHDGTRYDLQLASVAAFLGNVALPPIIFRCSRERMARQFAPDGSQPASASAHAQAFNLMCWVGLASIAQQCGEDLWHYQTTDGRGLRRALEWFLAATAEADGDRTVPLRAAYEQHYLTS